MDRKRAVLAGFGLIGISIACDMLAVLKFMESENGSISPIFLGLLGVSSIVCLAGLFLLIAGGKQKGQDASTKDDV